MIAVLEDWESAGANPPEEAPPQIVLADCYRVERSLEHRRGLRNCELPGFHPLHRGFTNSFTGSFEGTADLVVWLATWTGLNGRGHLPHSRLQTRS